MGESTVKPEIVMEYLVKFALLVILKEKNLLLQKNHNENFRDW